MSHFGGGKPVSNLSLVVISHLQYRCNELELKLQKEAAEGLPFLSSNVWDVVSSFSGTGDQFSVPGACCCYLKFIGLVASCVFYGSAPSLVSALMEDLHSEVEQRLKKPLVIRDRPGYSSIGT